jgi:hypothetical protein
MEETQLTPLEPLYQVKLEQRLHHITRDELVEFARQRGDTSIEGARRIIVTRLHAQLLDEQEMDRISQQVHASDADSSFTVSAHSAGDSSDADSGSDHDVALAEGFHLPPVETTRVSAALELERLLRGPAEGDLTLAQLLGLPKAEGVAFQDIRQWSLLFGRLNHNLDFLSSLYPPLRQRWGQLQLHEIRLAVIRLAISQLSDGAPEIEVFKSWASDLGIATVRQRTILLSQDQRRVAFLERGVPAVHRGWVGLLFATPTSTEVLRTALLCGVLADSPHRPGDLLHWSAVLFNAVDTSATARHFIVDDTLQGGLLALLAWIGQHEQVTVTSTRETASWDTLGLARTR